MIIKCNLEGSAFDVDGDCSNFPLYASLSALRYNILYIQNQYQNRTLMFDNFKPRLQFTKTEGNILMTQIRAERKYYQCRNEPVFLNSHRDASKTGKKVYKEQLYRTTVLYRDRDDHSRSHSHSYSRSPMKNNENGLARTGKRVGYDNPGIDRSPSARGKRKILQQRFIQINTNSEGIIGFDPKPRMDTSPIRYTRKRYDLSPNNQNKLSPGFNLFKSQN